jgi:chromosome segregation ATPase
MPPTIVETDLKEILGSIQKDLKDIRDDLTDLKVSQAEIRGDIANLKAELTLTREDVKDLKGRATAQIWTLIGLISSVITAIVAAAVKLGFFSNP